MVRTLTHKTIIGTTIYLVILAVIAATSLFVISRMLTSTETLLNFAVPLNEAHQQLYFNVKSAIEEAEVFSLSGEAVHREEAEQALEQAQASLREFNDVVSQSTNTFGDLAHLQRQQSALVPAVQEQVLALTNMTAANDQPGIQAARVDLQILETQYDQLNKQIDAFADGSQVRPTIAQLTSHHNLVLITIPAGFAVLGLLKVLELVMLRRSMIRPIKRVAAFAGTVAAGNLARVLPITSDDEIGELQQAINHMVGHLREQQSALEAHNAELQQGMAAQQRLFATVQQLGTPLLTLNDGVLLLPLIGHVDTQRAEAIMQALLHGVSEQRARVVILDVTGLAEVDRQVGQVLLQAVRATELLGAQVLLVGVTAALAQVIVTQGIDLSKLQTYRDVGTALREAVNSPLWISHNGASNGASVN